MGVIKERRDATEGPRLSYAIGRLASVGITDVAYEGGSRSLSFRWHGNTVRIWPCTGYFSGKGLKSGRGIENLIRQLKKQKI